MKTTKATVNGYKMTLVVIEAGEKVKDIRNQLGAEINDFNAARRGIDWTEEADYAAQYPKTYAAIKAAGIDISNAVAIAEWFPGAL